MYDELKDEVKKHPACWKKRLASYEKIYEEASTVKTTTKALMSGEPEYKKLIQVETLPELPELPHLENSISSTSRFENTNRMEPSQQREEGHR